MSNNKSTKTIWDVFYYCWFLFVIIIIINIKMLCSSQFNPQMRVFNACARVRLFVEIVKCAHTLTFLRQKSGWNITVFIIIFFPFSRTVVSAIYIEICQTNYSYPPLPSSARPLLPPSSRVAPHSEFSEYTRNLSKQPCGVCVVLQLYYYYYVHRTVVIMIIS